MDYRTKEAVAAHAKPVAEVLEAVLVLNYALQAARAAGWNDCVEVDEATQLVTVEMSRVAPWPAPPEHRPPSMAEVLEQVAAERGAR